jgi:hypothetical protein
MGYFSNGTEGEYYRLEYCAKCVHDQDADKGRGCPIWFLHLMHNYQECNKPDSFLHVLIPRSKDGRGNDGCTMFVERPYDPSCPLCDAGLPLGRDGVHCTKTGGYAGKCTANTSSGEHAK